MPPLAWQLFYPQIGYSLVYPASGPHLLFPGNADEIPQAFITLVGASAVDGHPCPWFSLKEQMKGLYWPRFLHSLASLYELNCGHSNHSMYWEGWCGRERMRERENEWIQSDFMLHTSIPSPSLLPGCFLGVLSSLFWSLGLSVLWPPAASAR